jgi:hypothetical protein
MPGRNRLAEPLDRLWDDKVHWTPALFLNATWVETGKRLIASNVQIVVAGAEEDFADVEDAQRFFAPRSLALSTAAHMSARFTYVSPAGTLVKDGKVHGRVVDGGYFENSGATTTLEVLLTIDQLALEDKRWKKVDPIVIHISNEPVDPRPAPKRCEPRRRIRPLRHGTGSTKSSRRFRRYLTRAARVARMRVKAYAGTWARRTSCFSVCAGARPTCPWVGCCRRARATGWKPS